MKIPITILAILIYLPQVSLAQNFEADPAQNKVIFKGGPEQGFEFILDEGGAPVSPIFQMNDEETSAPFFKVYQNPAPILELDYFDNSYFSRLTEQGVTFFQKVGNTDNPLYKLNRSEGFVAYDGNQNVTVRIQGNVGGDGRVTTSELQITGGSDLSESFNVTAEEKKVLPGMLVSISDREGELEITQSKLDKKVIGIVSGANGIETGMMMGQKGTIADGDYPIALTGRTYVLATTENGSIKPGDFITSSDLPGYGMKVKNAKKAQGAIIGKAMTSLHEGEGFVLVLVNLQ